MFLNYEDYRKSIFDMMNKNYESYNECVNNNWVILKEHSSSGEPYRLLTEEEFNQLQKDTSVIPEGSYCYTPDIEKNANKVEGDTKYYIKRCPYWTYIKDEGVDICYCSFLEEGSVPNSTSEEDFEKLEKKYGSEDAVWDKYPTDLLWDQVKICEKNDEYRNRKRGSSKS